MLQFVCMITKYSKEGFCADPLKDKVRPTNLHPVILPEGRPSRGPGNLHNHALAGTFVV